MHTDTSDIPGRGRPGRSGKPLSGLAIAALMIVAVAILTSAFFLLTPYLSQEAVGEQIVPAEPAE